MGGMARVTSEVRPSCVKNLAPRLRLGLGGDCARAQEGRARRNLRPRSRSRARRNLRPRPSLEGSGETEPASEARGVGRDGAYLSRGGRTFVLLPFVFFYPLNLGILFYGTQHLVSL